MRLINNNSGTREIFSGKNNVKSVIRKAFVQSGSDGKCIEARELIIALPEDISPLCIMIRKYSSVIYRPL